MWSQNDLLVRMEFEEGTTNIPRNVCSFCSSLETFIMPSTVINIETFILHGSSNIKSIICKATIPPVLADSFGYIASSSYRVYVPDSSVDAYKKAWTGIATDKIRPMSEYIEQR